jgi:homogentisate 1,2-dioxygenase
MESFVHLRKGRTPKRLHALPPTVHLFMEATGVYVMNFLPKPAEGVPGTERTPWYHRGVDYDEIAFFHGGVCTDCLHRHGFSSEGSAGPTPAGQGTTRESTQ